MAWPPVLQRLWSRLSDRSRGPASARDWARLGSVEGAPSGVLLRVVEESFPASDLVPAGAQVSEDFKKVELWICLKAPPISDGNNFGADVQNCVLGELKAMRHGIEGFLGGADAYHWARAIGIEKLVREPYEEGGVAS